MRALLLAALLAPAAALAHPHSHVDQQVALTLDEDRALLRVTITPSFTEGADIFAHIDRDGDGSISAAEADAFAADVMGAVHLTVAGQEAVFSAPLAEVPEQEAVAAGTAPIVLTVQAGFAPVSAGDEVALSMHYEALSHDWFLQPFLADALAARFPTPDIARSEDGHSLTLRFGN